MTYTIDIDPVELIDVLEAAKRQYGLGADVACCEDAAERTRLAKLAQGIADRITAAIARLKAALVEVKT